jgi:signal transduction histidine kinase
MSVAAEGVVGSGERRNLIARVRTAAPAGTWPVVGPVIAAAAVVVGFAFWEGVTTLAGPALLLLVAATLAEAFPVPIENVRSGETSFANVFIVTAAVIYGWQTAVIVGVLAMLLVEVYTHKPPIRMLYNASIYALAALAAGLVAGAQPEHYRTGLLSALAFYVVDIGLLAAAVALLRKQSYATILRSFYVSTLIPFAVMAATSAILVRLWLDSPWWALLIAPPLVAVGLHQRSLLATLARQRELDRMKDEFMAVISHELRTPLATVYGAAITLEERDLDETMQRRLINLIRRESTRQTKIVSDVLWASRLDAHKADARLQMLDVAAIAREVAATAAEAAPESISIEVDAGELPSLQADPEQVQLVLANLVDNAVKYSPGGGTIRVTLEAHDGRLIAGVSDHGLGIAEDDRERIFEKFTRLDPEMHRGVGGTGLGLYLCRELVTQMGGHLSVADNEPRGSTFSFDIPITAKGGKQ